MTSILDAIVYLFINAFDTYLMYLFMRLFFKNDFISKKAAVFVYSLYYVVSTLVYALFSFVFLNMISSIIVTFIVTLCYRSKISKKIIVTLLNYATMNICEGVVAAAIGLGGVDVFEISHYGDSFCLIAVELLDFAVIKIIGKFQNLNSNAPIPHTFSIIAILVPCVSVLFEILLFMQKNVSDLVYALSLICVVSLNFLLIYLYDSISKLFDKKIETEMAKQETKYYHKQAELIQNNSQKIKQLRHDMKNYTIALSELIKNNENEKALKYISSVSGILEPAKIYCNTGILSIDSIVNYKFTRAEEIGISVDSEITIPNNLNLNSNDLVAILGNLLDNAIEASSKAENKYIKFRTSYDRGTVLIVLTNSYNGELNFEGKSYKTTKEDNKAIHGIGLKSIKSAVEKYNGAMKVTHTDTEFSVRILLFN